MVTWWIQHEIEAVKQCMKKGSIHLAESWCNSSVILIKQVLVGKEVMVTYSLSASFPWWATRHYSEAHKYPLFTLYKIVHSFYDSYGPINTVKLLACFPLKRPTEMHTLPDYPLTLAQWKQKNKSPTWCRRVCSICSCKCHTRSPNHEGSWRSTENGWRVENSERSDLNWSIWE